MLCRSTLWVPPSFVTDRQISSLRRSLYWRQLPMFEGHPLIVTAQLEASQVELHKRNGAFFDLTRIYFCVSRFRSTRQLATSPRKHRSGQSKPSVASISTGRRRKSFANPKFGGSLTMRIAVENGP
jgi:hypothetical protein